MSPAASAPIKVDARTYTLLPTLMQQLLDTAAKQGQARQHTILLYWSLIQNSTRITMPGSR